MSKLEAGSRIRIRLVAALFILIFLVVIGRTFYLQIISGDKWQALAERQYHKTIPVAAQRGAIYDRTGEPMAISLDVDSVYIEPKRATKPVETAKLLAATLSLPYSLVKEKFDSDKGFLWLKRQITPEESEILRKRLRELKLDGVGFAKEHRRYYPNAQLGAQVIGFTGLDPDGLEGVELRYNASLLGPGNGILVTEKDNLGRGIGASGKQNDGSTAGSNLYLTIDRNLQYIAEKELAEGVRSSGSKAGCVIVMDPATGKVLAMASQPDFNPNAVSRYRPENWRNRALSDAFEPGSTSKVFLVAAALNEKVVQPGQLINCENGSYTVGGKTIHDHSGHGALTVTEILKYSSNIGSAKIGKRLERERLHKYLTGFGFGTQTGIDLPGETGGMLRKPSRWFEIDLAAISFGQGLTVTPLQVATAFGAIANGGKLMRPYVVERIAEADGTERHIAPKVVRQVVSRETSNIMRDMLMSVTEKGGTGTLAVVPGYRTAGKTGTAQKADPLTGGYSADKRVATFAGFIPAENPKLVVLALLDEPKGQVYGGLVAAPIFSRVAAQSLQYLGVPPTYPEDKDKILPTEEMVVNALKAAEMEGTEAVTTPPVEASDNSETVASGPLMPNFIGMSSRQVLQVVEKSGLNVKLVGSGRVVEQNPAAGLSIPNESEIWVRLETPGTGDNLITTSAL